MSEAMLSWQDRLRVELREQFGEAQGLRLYRRFGEEFPGAYREDYTPRTAILDIQRMEIVHDNKALAMRLYRPPEGQDTQTRIGLWLDNKADAPGRPEESHHQSPTEPHVNLSIHTARASRSLQTSRPPGDAESQAPPTVSWLAILSLSWLIPFAPPSLQGLPHYYWMIRPLHVHRYFPPSWDRHL
jgi:hypothetical protein